MVGPVYFLHMFRTALLLFIAAALFVLTAASFLPLWLIQDEGSGSKRASFWSVHDAPKHRPAPGALPALVSSHPIASVMPWRRKSWYGWLIRTNREHISKARLPLEPRRCSEIAADTLSSAVISL